MKKSLFATGLAIAMALPLGAQAADYVIDTKGAHASINFKVSHLGYSFIKGRFNSFSGDFSFDEKNIADSKVNVVVDTTSYTQTTQSVINTSAAAILLMLASTAKRLLKARKWLIKVMVS